MPQFREQGRLDGVLVGPNCGLGTCSLPCFRVTQGIQTERRNLTTLPNLYLVTNPVTVVRASVA